MKIYITIMYRWGDEEGHAYVIGAYSDELTARLAGKSHRIYRGGKYEPEVQKFEVVNNSTKVNIKQIYKNKENNEGLSVLIGEGSMFAIEDSLSDEDMLDLHDYLSSLNNEELVLLREWYSSYILK